MGRLRTKIESSFSAKVLLPVVTVMVLLVGVTGWLVNRRLEQQFHTQAERNLATADRVVGNWQLTRRGFLEQRYVHLPFEPQYKAVFFSGDRATLTQAIEDLPQEQQVDMVVCTAPDGSTLAAAAINKQMPLAEFATNSAEAARRAITGQEQVDTIRAGDQLFDVVSVPVGAAGTLPIGALTVGSAINQHLADDLRGITQYEVVLLANGHVFVSTLQGESSKFEKLFADCTAGKAIGKGIKEFILNDTHYFASAGTFASLSGHSNLGYLFLASYEQPLGALHSTQFLLVAVSLIGILLGTAVIWYLVREVTEPLRQLRDSAEAVGRGDFSRRVSVASNDECGKLATVFNQMTENLQQSRSQLEETVETLKTTQAQLVQSEKLSGIGQFVAGVAHELNNPLTSVMGFSELLMQRGEEVGQKNYLSLIHKSAQRCQKVVQSLLSFARRHQPERKISDVNELVQNALEFLAYQMRTSNIETVTRLDLKLPKLLIDPHQVQQVLLNIINNARQAIEGTQRPGKITIGTELAGDAICIRIQDNGPGIPEENLSKVFDPFFTTKDVGQGTGLGLSLCYGIIKEHGGTISVRSRKGEGATFTIELPVAAAQEELSAAAPTELTPQASSREGEGKRVLVIDDEEAILQMVLAALTRHGYQVEIRREGEAALACMQQNQFDLVLCDWKMPGLSGQQVYERLRRTDPGLADRMVFFTGDIINEKMEAFLRANHRLCLAKPFSLAEFRSAIARVVGGEKVEIGK